MCEMRFLPGDEKSVAAHAHMKTGLLETQTQSIAVIGIGEKRKGKKKGKRGIVPSVAKRGFDAAAVQRAAWSTRTCWFWTERERSFSRRDMFQLQARTLKKARA